MTDIEKIKEALDLIESYGGIDGGHHKQWVLDQVVQALTGNDYDKWVLDYEGEAEEGEEYLDYLPYSWDIGIAP